MKLFENLDIFLKKLPYEASVFVEEKKKTPLLANTFEQDCITFCNVISSHESALIDQFKTIVVNNFMIRKGEESECRIQFYIDYVLQHTVKIFDPDISNGQLEQKIEKIVSGIDFNKIHQYQKEVDWTWVVRVGNNYEVKVPTAGELESEFRKNFVRCIYDEGHEEQPGLIKMCTTGGLVIEITQNELFTQVACGFSTMCFLYNSDSPQMAWC